MNQRHAAEGSRSGDDVISVEFADERIGEQGFICRKVLKRHSGCIRNTLGNAAGVECGAALGGYAAKNLRKLGKGNGVACVLHRRKRRVGIGKSRSCVFNSEHERIVNGESVLRIVNCVVHKRRHAERTVKLVCRFHAGNKARNSNIMVICTGFGSFGKIIQKLIFIGFGVVNEHSAASADARAVGLNNGERVCSRNSSVNSVSARIKHLSRDHGCIDV